MQQVLIFGCQREFMAIFALVINILGTNQQLKHITIGLFDGMDILAKLLAKDLIELLGKYNLKENNITYVKDEGSKLNI